MDFFSGSSIIRTASGCDGRSQRRTCSDLRPERRRETRAADGLVRLLAANRLIRLRRWAPRSVPMNECSSSITMKASDGKTAVEAMRVVHEKRLDRLGRDQQHARGLFEHAALWRCRDVPVPLVDGDLRLLAELLQPRELVVDQRLERPDVNRSDTRGRFFEHTGQDGQEGRFGFPGRRPGRDDQVTRAVKDFMDGVHLYLAELRPAHPVERLLQRRVQTIEGRRSGFLSHAVTGLRV